MPEDNQNQSPLQLPDSTTPDSRLSMEFLRELAARDPGGKRLVTLCVKHGEGSMSGHTFDIEPEAARMRAFLIDKEDRKETNVYFVLNGVSQSNTGVPSDGDIATIRGAMIDIDLLPTTGAAAWSAERERIRKLVREQVMTLRCRPTYIIDSGNGCQLGWMYQTPVPVTAQTARQVLAIEQALQPLFRGGDKATTKNIKNLFRVPGTVNHPSRSKIERGAKAECFSGLWYSGGPLYDPAELQAWVDSIGQPPPEQDTGVSGNAGDLGLTSQALLDLCADPSGLPPVLRVHLDNIAHDSPHVRAYAEGNHDAVAKGDRSGADFRFAVILLQHGLSPAQTALCLAAHGSSKKEDRASDGSTVKYIVSTVLKAQSEKNKENQEGWPEPPKARTEETPYGETIGDFRFIRGRDARDKALADQKGLVEGLLDRKGLSMIIGPPNVGKSAFCILLGMAIVNGVRFDGRETGGQGGMVIYAAAEGSGGFDKRIKAAALNYPNLDPERFNILDGHFDVYSEKSAQRLARTLHGIQEKYGHIDLIIFDTLTAVSPGAKESSDDLKAVIIHLERVAAIFGCHVLIIHHTGKDKSRGARGWSGLLGAVDTEIMIDKGEHPATGIYRATKQRDMILDETDRWFALKSITLGETGGRLVTGVTIEFIAPIRSEDSVDSRDGAILSILRKAGKLVDFNYVFEHRRPYATLRQSSPNALRMDLHRLYLKGVVHREKVRRAWMYSAMPVSETPEPDEDDEIDNNPFA